MKIYDVKPLIVARKEISILSYKTCKERTTYPAPCNADDTHKLILMVADKFFCSQNFNTFSQIHQLHTKTYLFIK